MGALCTYVFSIGMVTAADAAVISGNITDWDESGSLMNIGDGGNSVNMWWSITTFDKGWFYGSSSTGDSDVAFASGVTTISDISDASVFTYNNDYTGPHCDADCATNGVGDFLVWKNTGTGHYGVLRIDDIIVQDINVPLATLYGTWWFQTDGTGDFSSAVVPIPPALWLFCSGLLGLVGITRRKKAA
jgi:hypothetical protein